jgi:uncharacterized radical SAM superfamily Fe-S cluster-containing enzyme
VTLFLHLTTHVTTDKDQDLLDEKGGNGFPYLVFLDADGALLARHEGPRNTEGFVETLKEAEEYRDQRAKAAAGDKALAKEVFFKDAELGNHTYQSAKDATAKLGDLTDDEKAKLADLLVTLECKGVMSALNKKAKDLDPSSDSFQTEIKKLQAEAGREYMKMEKAGKAPKTDDMIQPFYIFIMEAAEAAKDAETYEKALKILEDKFGGNPRAKPFFEARHQTLDELKAGGGK